MSNNHQYSNELIAIEMLYKMVRGEQIQQHLQQQHVCNALFKLIENKINGTKIASCLDTMFNNI